MISSTSFKSLNVHDKCEQESKTNWQQFVLFIIISSCVCDTSQQQLNRVNSSPENYQWIMDRTADDTSSSSPDLIPLAVMPIVNRYERNRKSPFDQLMFTSRSIRSGGKKLDSMLDMLKKVEECIRLTEGLRFRKRSMESDWNNPDVVARLVRYGPISLAYQKRDEARMRYLKNRCQI